MKKKKDPELPSFISGWKQMYFIVVLNLALLILLFYFFTKYFE
ncbi:MAG TPA: hypothetical protein PKM16_07530 [Bacteroidia bacterium]|nr:hypothetical protein [Bacteroidia bacterium]